MPFRGADVLGVETDPFVTFSLMMLRVSCLLFVVLVRLLPSHEYAKKIWSVVRMNSSTKAAEDIASCMAAAKTRLTINKLRIPLITRNFDTAFVTSRYSGFLVTGFSYRKTHSDIIKTSLRKE